MWPFDIFKKKPKELYPECLWTVETGTSVIRVTDQAGKTSSIAFSDLAGVAIETNDSGPWGADVWWMIFDSDGKMACAFPQGASGEKIALEKLMALPGFDHQRMIEAMGSTSNAVFPVWQKGE